MISEIKKAQVIPVDSWDLFWENTLEKTFFQSYGWNKVWELTWPSNYKAICYDIEWSDGTRILLPGVERKLARGLCIEFLSAPGNCAGGPIQLSGDFSQYTKDRVLNYLKKKYNSATINQLNLSGNYSDILSSDYTYIIDFQEVDIDHIYNNSRAGQYARNSVKKGLKLSNHGEISPDEFIQLYKTMLGYWTSKNLEVSDYSDEFFYHLYKQKNVELTGVRNSEGNLIAAGYFLLSPNHVVSWLTLANPDYRNLHALEFLYFDLFERFRANGVRYFDFNPSRSLEGLESFKKKFGASPFKMDRIHFSDTLYRTLNKMSKIFKWI